MLLSIVSVLIRIIQLSLANPNFILAVNHSPSFAITGIVIPSNPFLQWPQFFLSQFHEEAVLPFARDYFFLPNSVEQSL